MIDSILQHGLELGADFVDIFREENRKSSFSYKDQKVDSLSRGIDFGFGIRMILGSEVLYVQSNREDESHLLALMSDLVSAHGWQPGGKKVAGQEMAEVNSMHPVARDPSRSGQQEKLSWCRLADETARAVSPKVAQVAVNAIDQVQEVLIANSEGLYVEDRRTRCRFSVMVNAADQGELTTSSESPGALQGREFFDSLDIEALAKSASDRAVRMLDAGYIEGGKMPVIIGNAFGGVIFHEACGHPLETEAVRKKATPFADKLGEQIAQPCLTAIDDGTMPGVWGSINVDDEGMQAQKTTLIEKGILRNFLSDRVGAMELGLPRTGSGRRESFRYAPVSRMRNTYIAPGEDEFDDMVNSVEDGFFAKVLGGGSVNPSTGEFNFAVQEGYRISGGKLGEPLRGATLIGKGHEIMPRISMVGKDLELASGMCGASSGSVPVTVGQPTLKVDEILVGGR